MSFVFGSFPPIWQRADKHNTFLQSAKSRAPTISGTAPPTRNVSAG
jgi:hypothetical protein